MYYIHEYKYKKELIFLYFPPSHLQVNVYSSNGNDAKAKKEPHPTRKARWDELNAISLNAHGKTFSRDSTKYNSLVPWSKVEPVFSPISYIQPMRMIDEKHLISLQESLSNDAKCLGFLTTREAKRRYFIYNVLKCVSILFDGDLQILVEEDVYGRTLGAHGHFEFMIKRGNKVVCVVEAKKDDMEQGMTKVLVGCEVVAECGESDVVYGIVTNYLNWSFLRSFNDKIELEENTLSFYNNLPILDSLKEITGKIYAMLSDDDNL